MRKMISMMLVIVLLVLPVIPDVSYGTTGHLEGCPNTEYDTNCCTKTFNITAKEGYKVIDVIVNGESKGPITDWTFSNMIGTQTLKVVTEKLITQYNQLPQFTYKDLSGNILEEGVGYRLIDDGIVGGVQNWRIKFLTSGVLKFIDVNSTIDVFCVGGGEGGGCGNLPGGGGGYTTTQEGVVIKSYTDYYIEVGQGGSKANVVERRGGIGGTTTAFGVVAKGGGSIAQGHGGSGGGAAAGGGVAGTGGSDGNNGENIGYNNFGCGQGTTTKEFGEATGTLYAGGGGGGATYTGIPGAGGAGGGGSNVGNVEANTGGGGGSTYYNGELYVTPGDGGSGIVVIRNSSILTEILPEFEYSGTYQLLSDGVVNGVQNWRIKFLTSGILKFEKINTPIDVFCVGGGEGGGCGNVPGGGGGYTTTEFGKTINVGTQYGIVIGNGGSGATTVNTRGEAGGKTTAFGVEADGGGTVAQGYGGSGGGAWSAGSRAGTGGSDGNNGENIVDNSFGYGQGPTTKEFGELFGTLYSGGGGGGASYIGSPGVGGAGGGGSFGNSGETNTGGGGGSTYYNGELYVTPGNGGSGIVVIRNIREAIEY